MKIILFILLIPHLVKAAEPIELTIGNLSPVSHAILHGTSPNITRFLMRFKNTTEDHFFVYDEDSSLPPIKEAQQLLQDSNYYESSCNVQLECTNKPICSDNCQSMYYQLTNVVNGAGNPSDSSKCKIITYVCGQKLETKITPAAAAPPPPAPQVSPNPVAPAAAPVPVVK